MLNFSHSVIDLIENLNSVSFRYKYLHFYNRIYSNMETKIKCFDGTGDVNVFVEKVSLHSSLKGYDGEKAAQNLASKLEGRAFDVYMRLPTADKKDASKIKSELLKEFESGNVDREAAIVELNNRRRKSDESPQTFAYKLISLVKLAYPTFDDSNQKTIAKDYFLKGLHPKMQIALKSLPNFTEIDVDKLATETMRLQLAGIDSFAAGKTHECMSVESPSMVDAIAEKVIEKLRNSTIADHGADDGGEQESLAANFVSNQWRGYPRRGKQNRFPKKSYHPRATTQQNSRPSQSGRKCRSCQSPDHFVRECPNRYCQACGNQGHDAWNALCPKYQ